MARITYLGKLATRRRSVRLHFVAFLLLISSTAGISAPQAKTIAKIEVQGLQRSTPEEVVATSGLKIGQTFAVDVLDEAAAKLANSGLFKKVAYRTRTSGNAVLIVLLVEETKGGTSPVLFDNFIWFSDDELMAAIRRDVPTFSGTAPDAGETITSITGALQKLLKEHNIEGIVEHMTYQTERANTQEHLFTVIGVKLPICTLHFSGTKAVSEEKLIKNSKELAGTEFSRRSTGVFAVTNLYPLYREVGHLRAKFGEPLAKPLESANCKTGVDLTIPVDEGPIYSWEKAEWSGNRAMSLAGLDTALGMTSGEVASGLKLDKGLANLRKSYARKGYLTASFRDRPEVDDVALRVTYKINVSEGPQFRMGNLIVRGFSEGEERFLREKWRLMSGDVFDQGYLEEFLNTSFGVVMNRPGM
ncbi:MAG: POTRA domain-containing protein [Pyrinomonadaceae bacterium]